MFRQWVHVGLKVKWQKEMRATFGFKQHDNMQQAKIWMTFKLGLRESSFLSPSSVCYGEINSCWRLNVEWNASWTLGTPSYPCTSPFSSKTIAELTGVLSGKRSHLHSRWAGASLLSKAAPEWLSGFPFLCKALDVAHTYFHQVTSNDKR